jgi:hypothetical protein
MGFDYPLGIFKLFSHLLGELGGGMVQPEILV